MGNESFLIEIHHGIGDVVDMLYTIYSIRRAYPNAVIDVLVGGRPQSDIIANTGLVNNTYQLNFRKLFTLQMMKLIFMLRKKRYTYGILSPISNKKLGALLLYIAGCRIRVGEDGGKELPSFLDLTVKAPCNPERHVIDRNFDLLNSIGIQSTWPEALITFSSELDSYIESVFKGKEALCWIGVAISSNPFVQKISMFKSVSHDMKKWDVSKYCEIMEQLTLKGYGIVLLGGAKEENDLLPYEKEININPRILNMVNKTSIIQTAALIKKCKFIFGNETGMMHIADAVRVPTATIFGPTNPYRCGAYITKNDSICIAKGLDCQYCYETPRMFECEHRSCITKLETEEVLTQIIDFLSR